MQLNSQDRNNLVWALKVLTGAQILYTLILIMQKRCRVKCGELQSGLVLQNSTQWAY